MLDNEHTLTGDIERVDDQYRIKRLIGETCLPATKVLKLCASLEEAYAFLRGRTNLNDPDERLRLAEWCRQHGLRDQALVEAQAAVSLRPRDGHAKRLVGYLQDSRTRAAAPTTPAVVPAPLPRVDVSAEALSLFASRIQPILMNACANCHTAGRGGSFQLTRTFTSGMGNRRALDQNLAVCITFVDVLQPKLSRLLTKSVSIHGTGMTAAPLRGRGAPAYRALEQWVLQTLANNPHMRQTLPPANASASVSPALTLPAPPSVANPSGWGEDRKTTPPDTGADPSPAPVVGSQEPTNDPVDPESFNRAFHPERASEPIKKP